MNYSILDIEFYGPINSALIYEAIIKRKLAWAPPTLSSK
jgi:hypothetical protein